MLPLMGRGEARQLPFHLFLSSHRVCGVSLWAWRVTVSVAFHLLELCDCPPLGTGPMRDLTNVIRQKALSSQRVCTYVVF